MLNHEEYLHKISKRIQDLFFVEIGAMDGKSFDPLYKFVKQYKWKGVLVEPLGDLFELLKINYKECTQLYFENSAITDQEEIRPIFRVPMDIVTKGEVPLWVGGSSSFYNIADYKKYTVQENVNCITLKMLIDKYDISKVDVLQIDTEGYDYKIFKQFDFDKFRPYFIRIEICHLSMDERQEIMLILDKERYYYNIEGINLLAVKNIKYI